jgi:hypothetical protein
MTKTSNTRMEDALALADLCWSKASGQFPEFVERYLELAEELLLSKPQVTGDEFREHCRANGLYRPQGLHHNVWVSAVRFVHKLGWTTPIKKVEPVKTHNHMPSVTLWHSELFGKQTEED